MVTCCVNDKSKQNRQHLHSLLHVRLLVWSSCSSPYTKGLHALPNYIFTTPCVCLQIRAAIGAAISRKTEFDILGTRAVQRIIRNDFFHFVTKPKKEKCESHQSQFFSFFLCPFLTFSNYEKCIPRPVWPDWAIYWTLGNFSKPLATIVLSKSQTFLSNFWKGSKLYHFLLKYFLGNFYRHLAIFSVHTVHDPQRDTLL